jgi:hypothetical protein
VKLHSKNIVCLSVHLPDIRIMESTSSVTSVKCPMRAGYGMEPVERRRTFGRRSKRRTDP